MIPDRNRRAVGVADLRREGKTLVEIGRMFGVTGNAIRYQLEHGCPAFHEAPRKKRLRGGGYERPAWSYPDQQTLALARRIRREMETGR